MRGKRILFIGLGNLGSQIFDLCLRIPGKHTFLVGGKNETFLHQRTNLSLLAALQLGYMPDVTCTYMDLWNIEQTTETIARFQPDIIVCSAVLTPWYSASLFSAPLAERLATLPMGPRLPLYLTLVYKLMQAIKATGQPVKVINAIYPDVVHPILKKVGLAPTTGIGDLANNIPAVRKSLAIKLDSPLENVDVRLVMARYVSYWMSRTSVTGMPFHLTAFINKEDMTRHLDIETVFDLLPTTFKRSGGIAGLLLTAVSAMVVIEGMVRNTGIITHAPGPNGFPGGYPVQVDEHGVRIVLPAGLTMESALQINEAGIRLDGIKRIDEEGTIYFTEREMAIFKNIMGYECQKMPLAEVEYWARELQARYQALQAT